MSKNPCNGIILLYGFFILAKREMNIGIHYHLLLI